MVSVAVRPIQHLAAWFVWHSMRVSLLPDAHEPQLPGDAVSQ